MATQTEADTEVDPFGFDEPAPIVLQPAALRGSPVSKRKEVDDRAAVAFRELEAEIHAGAASVCADAMRAFDLDEQGNADEDWEAELGPKKAQRRKRVAQMALLSAKEAPIALKMATQLLSSTGRNLANVGEQRSLNIQIVNMPAVHTQFAELEVDEEK